MANPRGGASAGPAAERFQGVDGAMAAVDARGVGTEVSRGERVPLGREAGGFVSGGAQLRGDLRLLRGAGSGRSRTRRSRRGSFRETRVRRAPERGWRSWREVEALEDGSGDGLVFDGGEQLQCRATARAAQSVDGEHAGE